jgi:hypothetical protein
VFGRELKVVASTGRGDMITVDTLSTYSAIREILNAAHIISFS